MKQFFGAFFGSIVGMLVASLLCLLLVIAIIKVSVSAAFKDGTEETSVTQPNSILRLKLEGEIHDREKDNPFKEFGDDAGIFAGGGLGVNTLLRKLQTAQTDDNIKGIYICFRNLNAGFATLRELREAIREFRQSGKFVYAYAEDFSQKEYFLASAADKVFLHPEGSLEWKGIGMTLMFFKHTFEKLDVDMQVFRHGKFKSAVEPFLLDKMSEANRMQSKTFLNSIWTVMLNGVAKDRKIEQDQLNVMADSLSIRFASDALGTLVDALAYEDQVIAELKNKLGIKASDKLKYVDISSYHERKNTDVKLNSQKIAVIYASGAISGGEGDDNQVGSDRLAKAIREARLDEKIKAIVLRVNSPGGSALASDVIWREMFLAQKVKPTVVSMGDLAASGGYYISCAAGHIFAQPNTITGSIGVFGVIPNLQRMLEKKFGITVDTVNTNRFSDIATGLRPVSEHEHNYIQGSVERVYDTFTKRVAEGRKLSQALVDSIGQGRVWSGEDALRIGLVDQLGGLNDALAFAAKKASLKDYKLVELPRQKGPFDGLLGTKEREMEARILKNNLGPAYVFLKQIRTILELKGVQARLPFEVVFN
jgi:protease IV